MGENLYFGKEAQEEWYQAMLKDGIMSLGNNARLKRLIERSRAGETVTLAAIGGSITEGAGAAQYNDCYAKRFFKGFTDRYGAGDGSNVRFVNAGVGGTPSPFGLMRYQQDVVSRVQDGDGLPDLVIVEFAVNDYEEPTKHRAYESLVKTILEQPNDPVVILLFSVFPGGYNIQGDLQEIGSTYDLMMVSIKNAAYAHVGQEWTEKEFFFDQYHPTSLGHAVMADCLLCAVETANAAETAARDIDLSVDPAYGTDFMGLVTLYGSGEYPSDIHLSRGGFAGDDLGSYTNLPVGRVCGPNFFHDAADSDSPLTLTATFRKLLIAWRATGEERYGAAEILVDGQVKRTLQGGQGKWGQSEVVLIWDAQEPAEHTVEIRMTEETTNKRFTITANGYAQ